METDVIRVYRRNRGAVTGILASTARTGARPFGSLDELRGLLEQPVGRATRRRRRTIPPRFGGNAVSAAGDGNGVHRLRHRPRQMNAAIVDPPGVFRSLLASAPFTSLMEPVA